MKYRDDLVRLAKNELIEEQPSRSRAWLFLLRP
jgi:hypothetical protein